jgi:hypothetical protein
MAICDVKFIAGSTMLLLKDLLLSHPQKYLLPQQIIPKNQQLNFSAVILFTQQIIQFTRNTTQQLIQAAALYLPPVFML